MANEAGAPQDLVLTRSGGVVPRAHSITVRDLRQRYGDPEEYQAQCSCGWLGERHTGGFAARSAGREGDRHVEEHRRPGSRR
jgi:hypothetical protein